MITTICYYFIAILIAGMEVEIEGKFGWMEKMPTPYIVTGWPAKIWSFFQGGRPLTIYHLYIMMLALLISHMPFVGIIFYGGIEWSMARELTTLAIFFVWIVTWDFAWFVLNPYYGVKNFKKYKIWWHSKNPWIGGLFPLDYLIAGIISIVSAYEASIIDQEPGIFTDFLLFLISFFVLMGITILVIAPPYMRWYRRMRISDEREKVRIFHVLPEYAGMN